MKLQKFNRGLHGNTSRKENGAWDIVIAGMG
jgi:hypothetical protein